MHHLSSPTGPVIAIDGPAGAGKSTVSRQLARELGLRYLDTGAMYRALALKAGRAGISLADGDAVAALMEDTTIEFGEGDPQVVLLDGVDVTEAIRTPEAGESASKISTSSPVRRALVRRQQAMVADRCVVLEGRDATTKIAPNADVKVYLTASLEERAKRRALELGDRGLPIRFETVRTQLEHRDHRDITREDSPLTVASGAHVVETAGRTIDEVVAAIKALVS